MVWEFADAALASWKSTRKCRQGGRRGRGKFARPLGQRRVRSPNLVIILLPPYSPSSISEWICRTSALRRRIRRPSFFNPKRLSLIISFPKRLTATSTRKIGIEMKIFFSSGGAFGGHFGPPNGSKTLRWRWFNGCQSHSGSSRPLTPSNIFPETPESHFSRENEYLCEDFPSLWRCL